MQKYSEKDWFLDRDHSADEIIFYKADIVVRSVDVFEWVLKVVPNNTSLGWKEIKSFLEDIKNGLEPDESQFERVVDICKAVVETSSNVMNSRSFNEVADLQMDARTVKREAKKVFEASGPAPNM